ncbi:MAG: phosphoglycerate kinase [Gemmatimonadaceae bacterium]
MNKRTVRDLSDAEIQGKRALVRVDFNVPQTETREISDDTRIRAALPTIDFLIDRGASVVLLSHLGRPEGKPAAKYSLLPVADHLRKLVRHPVTFLESADSVQTRSAVESLEPGSILLLENTRFLGGEEANDEKLSRSLALLGDFYVNDAFGAAHRAHASTEGITRFLRPAVAGLLMEKELRYLGSVLHEPERPFVALLGGAKISGKIDVIQSLLPKVDRLLIGGAMACTFFRAMGFETGKSLVEEDRVSMAGDLLRKAGDKLLLPADATVAASLEAFSGDRNSNARFSVVDRAQIPRDQAMFDIGSESADRFAGEVTKARTVVWNGPMGVFETPPFDRGTLRVAQAMSEATSAGATTIVGGGDSAAAVARLGLESKMSHVSTGGGASLEFLEGKTLPGVAALDDS